MTNYNAKVKKWILYIYLFIIYWILTHNSNENIEKLVNNIFLLMHKVFQISILL